MGAVLFPHEAGALALAMTALARRGLQFTLGPQLIAEMDDHDLWMAFFTDPDGHTLALMQEAPKGHVPKPANAN
jgi:methylmalonyl-CoA/ethylmalonyl-CoA epimerase